ESDITIVATKSVLHREDVGKQIIIEPGESGTVADFLEQTSDLVGERLVSTNIIILKRELLQSMVLEALSHNHHHIYKDSFKNYLPTKKIMYYEHKGYYATIKSIVDYYKTSMELLEPETRDSLFNVEHRAIYTKVRNSTPTKYEDDAVVENSLIADGCIIEGTVKNSILFRGVKVGKGTVVENSIMLQDTYTGENVSLNCVITDKNVVIRDGRRLSGHETIPFYINKGAMI
ncbi:MAG: glucose-1-phosphate adenylyltransferase subunit GlgD, partial [Clostridia bacterium]|nr:glucose-1-phosphate adenylyltransferase subunit GlgD [Clostridia bacterium]